MAGWLPAGGVRFSRPEVTVPREVEAALDKQVRDLGYRTAALRKPPLLEVLENPGFDRPADGQNPLPGWTAVQPAGVSIQRDTQTKYSGDASARLSSTGPVGSLVSRPFPPPVTGRLTMLVRMRVADAAKQPPVRLVIEGRQGERTVAFYARFGKPIDSDAAPPEDTRPIAVEWSPYLMEVVDLPLETLSAMRVRLELSGPGEVWIDDVQLCDLAFNAEEL